jgi:preprotein translocase subunit SecG
MQTLLQVIHIIDAFVLILVVLLQQGKGAGMGLAFGGASSSVFGGAGAGNFFTKVTTWAAVVFMITSLSLAYLGGRSATSLMKNVTAPAAKSAPAETGAATAPTGAAGAVTK